MSEIKISEPNSQFLNLYIFAFSEPIKLAFLFTQHLAGLELKTSC